MSGHRLIITSNGLTSRDLQSEFQRMIGSSPETKNVWYLPTAPLRDGMSMGFVKSQVADLKRTFRLGRIEIIDVEYVKGEKLKQAIQDLGKVDVIYAEMGNTYNLRHHLRNSGGDHLIKEAMDAGAIYVGSSAGSIVAGRTIQMAFWKDWDDRTAENTISVNWEDKELSKGLDLGGGRSFFPHANGQYGRKSWQDEKARQYGHTDHEVIKMADGEGFVIDGDKAYPVGSQSSCF